MASVIGLAPIRPGLKDRLLELLCIHGRLAKLVPEVGIAPTSPRLQRGANLSQLFGGAGARPLKLVVPRGNAPRSSGYQPDALLLSYETFLICGFKPKRAGRNEKFSFTEWIRMRRLGL